MEIYGGFVGKTERGGGGVEGLEGGGCGRSGCKPGMAIHAATFTASVRLFTARNKQISAEWKRLRAVTNRDRGQIKADISGSAVRVF